MMLQSALAFEQIIKVKEFPSLYLFNFSGICAYFYVALSIFIPL